MRAVEFALAAALDIDEILATSETEFGARTAARYGRLMDDAFAALAVNPDRNGVKHSPDTPPNVFLFHLRAVRTVAPPGERIGKPRHPIVFTETETHVSILLVLHDSIDLPAHIG